MSDLARLIREALHHAADNEHHLDPNCQGVHPGEYVPAVRAKYIEDALEVAEPTAQPTVEAVKQAIGSGWTEAFDEWGKFGPLFAYDISAAAVMALLPGRPESVVKAEALRDAATQAARTPLARDEFVGWLCDSADRIEAGG